MMKVGYEMLIHPKEYLEEYARLSLAEILGFNINALVHSDAPDIQDIENQIGIEVVEDTYQNEKELLRFWMKYETTPVDMIPNKKIDGYYKRHGTLKIDNNQLKGGSLGESKPNSPKHLITTINKKLRKLNSGNYAVFQSYMLYVFVDTVSLFNSYVVSVIQEARKTNEKLKYNKLILDGYYELCYCDLETQRYRRYNISKATRETIDTKAKSMVYDTQELKKLFYDN